MLGVKDDAMKRSLIAASVLVLGACATASDEVAFTAPAPNYDDLTAIALASICGADAGIGLERAPDIALVEGMGTGGFAVDSQVKAAQDWFDYGLALSHAFYHNDAVVAMERAVAADPDCSICASGLAWVRGPTLNYGINDTQREGALEAAQSALALAKPGDEKARRLAEVLIARYETDGPNVARDFGRALADLSANYPEDTDIAVMAGHALLIPFRAGDRTNVDRALALLEDVLEKDPNNTGAMHFYIHGTEFDGRAEDALEYAARLGELAPMASHLVHMPAHTWFRSGYYFNAATANADAIAADMKWLEEGGDSTGSAPAYYAHNLSFGIAGALMSGKADLALKYADHAQRMGEVSSSIAETVEPRSWVGLALFDPERAITLPEPEDDASIRERVYYAYARGEAFVRTGDLAGAREMLARLETDEEDHRELTMARHVLTGRIAMAEGDTEGAISAFEAAADYQDETFATSWDPPSWWYPTRRSLAAAYLEAGDYRAARRESQRVLRAWKHDPMALRVLADAERALGQNRLADRHDSEARRMWAGEWAPLDAGRV